MILKYCSECSSSLLPSSSNMQRSNIIYYVSTRKISRFYSDVTGRRFKNTVASKDSAKMIQRDLRHFTGSNFICFIKKKIEPDATFK